MTTAAPAAAPDSAADDPLGGAILFTAFEPSGDQVAAPVIRALLERRPNMKVYAWGGPRMAEAGATLIEETAVSGAMGLGAIARAGAVRREHKRIKRWAMQYRVVTHVAVDSPAANWGICKIMRNRGAKIVHLVAPQLWAWGGWRIRKLRRLTDLVLCVLPFEDGWFNSRQVPAKFIGHPAINRELDRDLIVERMHGLPAGAPRVAIFPGSRLHEVRANLPLLVKTYAELQARNSGMTGVFVSQRPEVSKLIRKKLPVFPTGLHITSTDIDPCIAWADVCLAVSGTVTLHIARHCKPLIGVYKVNPIAWLLSKVMLRTPFRLLPNIIAEEEICPEFVPHVGGADPVIREMTRLLSDSRHGARQREALSRVCLRFSQRRPADDAADAILNLNERSTAPTR